MARFEITIVKEFESTASTTATEQAEDWAYAVTDKGEYEVRELEKQ